MTAVRLGQQSFQAVGSGSSLCRAKYFYDFIDICQNFHSNGSDGTVGRTTGFWSGRYGFESQPLLTFFNLIITMENRDAAPAPPSYAWKVSMTEFFETRKGSPTKFFGTETKNRRKILIFPPSYP